MAVEARSARPGLRGQVTRPERRFVLAFGALVMLATTLPYLLGYAVQGTDFRFTGFVFGVEDGNSYIAKMLSGWAGAWLFRSPYTASPQRGLLFYLPYLLLGKLAAPPGLHEQLVALYHLFRVAAGMLSILATYDFLAYFVQDVRLRRTGLALVTLGGGLGWALVAAGRVEWLGSQPLDFISPETFGFLGIFGIAHLPLGRALLLWALLAYLRLYGAVFETPDRRPPWKGAAALSALWLASGVFNPLCLLVAGLVIVIHLGGLLIWGRRRASEFTQPRLAAWRRLALQVVGAGLLPGLLLAYNLAVALADPYASGWTAQNRILSPHPAHYLLAYGLLIPYCWVGGRRLLREDFPGGWFLVGWVLAVPLLVYLPVDLQRRLTEGAWVAIGALGMAALDQPAAGAARPDWRLAPLLLAFPSTLFLLAGGLMSAYRPGPPRFIASDQARLFETLQQRAPVGAVTLCAYETANPLPAWAPVRVLAGHGPESLQKTELLLQIQLFFDPAAPDALRRGLIREYGIEYVIWGEAEKALGSWQPGGADFLEPVATSGATTLYRTRSGAP